MDFLNNNMFSILLYNSPLEQFEVFSIFIVLHATISKTFFNNIFIYFFGILSSNVFIMLVLISFFLFFSFFVLLKKNKLFPNYNLFFFFEIIFDFIQSLIKQNIGNKKDELIFNNILLFIFILILFGNLFGMVPYSYTITSHLIFTFALSLSIFLGINIIAALSLK
jgi:F0F1-type ATP synthase membrane subunit a